MPSHFDLSQTPELIRVIAAVCSALATLLPFWDTTGMSKAERAALVLFAFVLVLRFWPLDFSYCGHINAYGVAAIVLPLCYLLAWAADTAIIRQYGHSQKRRDDELISSATIIGGPVLTQTAEAMQARNPALTTQQIFDRLDGDPLQMWERSPRTRLLVAHRLIVFIKVLALLLAAISVVALLKLWIDLRVSHRELSLTPLETTVIADSDRSVEFMPSMRECCPDITWSIEGSSSAIRNGEVGEISKTGTYFPPDSIRREIDVYVVATPSQHPREFKKAKIHIRFHPRYSEGTKSLGTDTAGRTANFVIEVLDQRYSWKIGTITMEGQDGAALARRMYADGVFSGFREIICIGAASREIETTQLGEEQRALDRANVLGRWVRDAVGPGRVRIHGLKVGRYDEELRLSPEQTARERQVVIVGVLPGADRNVDLLSALRDAFAQKRREEPLLGMYLDAYPPENWRLVNIPDR
jgi:hypothetical protein